MGLTFNANNCTGCRLCQLVCSAKHEGVFNLGLARLKITSYYSRNGLVVNAALCTQCLECVQVCSVNAIAVEDGLIVLDGNSCIACRQCSAACPEGVIVSREAGVGICDMCGGSPACIAWCPHKALSKV